MHLPGRPPKPLIFPHLNQIKRNWPLYNTVLAKLNQFPEEFADLHEIMENGCTHDRLWVRNQTLHGGIGQQYQNSIESLLLRWTLNDKAFGPIPTGLDQTQPVLLAGRSPCRNMGEADLNRSTWAMIPDEFKRTSGAKTFFPDVDFSRKRNPLLSFMPTQEAKACLSPRKNICSSRQSAMPSAVVLLAHTRT